VVVACSKKVVTALILRHKNDRSRIELSAFLFLKTLIFVEK
jgi:hypothetical protein